MSDHWFNQAACRGKDPDIFFPRSGESPAAARRICATCPVRLDCRAYAFAHHITRGVWGGLTELERRKHRRNGAAA